MNSPVPQTEAEQIADLKARLAALENKAPNPLALVVVKTLNSYKSWTMWFNSVGVAIAAAMPYVEANVPQLQPYLGAAGYQKLAFGILIVNMMLRYKTDKPLEEK